MALFNGFITDIFLSIHFKRTPLKHTTSSSNLIKISSAIPRKTITNIQERFKSTKKQKRFLTAKNVNEYTIFLCLHLVPKNTPVIKSSKILKQNHAFIKIS